MTQQTQDRTELYIIVTKGTEAREVGPLTVRGFGRAHTNLKGALQPDEKIAQLVVRVVRITSEETHGIDKADAVLKAIVAKGRTAEIDAEIERLVQERRKLQGEMFPADERTVFTGPGHSEDARDPFDGHDPA